MVQPNANLFITVYNPFTIRLQSIHNPFIKCGVTHVILRGELLVLFTLRKPFCVPHGSTLPCLPTRFLRIFTLKFAVFIKIPYLCKKSKLFEIQKNDPIAILRTHWILQKPKVVLKVVPKLLLRSPKTSCQLVHPLIVS